MFDVGFSELVVIAVVALIVIGPERLPTVARTLGHLLGRLQRYVGDVKADIQREMQLEELKKLQAEIENQARGIERTVVQEMQSVEKDLNAPAESLSEIIASTKQELAETTPAAPSLVDFDPRTDIPGQMAPTAAPVPSPSQIPLGPSAAVDQNPAVAAAAHPAPDSATATPASAPTDNPNGGVKA